MPESKDTIQDAVFKLTHMLPNVDKLHIESSYPSPALLMLYRKLCHKLKRQLRSINTNTHFTSLPYLTASKLKYMRITLEHNDPHTHTRIIPPSLAELNFNFSINFEWVTFVAYNWAAFTNITYLRIQFNEHCGSRSTKPALPVYKKPKVLFPSLTRLAIHHAPLTLANCKDPMQSPLQVLEYKGPVSIANHLCTYAPSSIKVLRVGLETRNHSLNEDDTFRIRSYFRNAYLDLRAPKANIDMARTYWLQFTHVRLDISHKHNIGAIVQALPNAVHLHFVLALFDESEYKKTQTRVEEDEAQV